MPRPGGRDDRDIIGDCPSAVWWPPGVLGPGAKKVQFASGLLFIVARRRSNLAVMGVVAAGS
jgi:hypothetical protein